MSVKFNWGENVLLNKQEKMIIQLSQMKNICKDIKLNETNEDSVIWNMKYKIKKFLKAKVIVEARNSPDIVNKFSSANLDFNQLEDIQRLKFVDFQVY